MGPDQIRELLTSVRDGSTGVDEALARLRSLPFEDLGFARVDYHRHIRQGFPEVIFCQGKRVEQIVQIASRLAEHSPAVLGTRAGPDAFEAVSAAVPGSRYFPVARIFLCGEPIPRLDDHPIVVVSGGTADEPMAEEAAVTAEAMGNAVDRIYDVGVAGLHRLLENVRRVQSARVVVAVAGMEGALASVVGGLVSVPVIALPTSVGYGSSFQGVAALLAMLNSCATGVAVVNIDNGFGAGYLAAMINRQGARAACA